MSSIVTGWWRLTQPGEENIFKFYQMDITLSRGADAR